jgi:DNA-binding winged helix-turn-helix (wHTH) protein
VAILKTANRISFGLFEADLQAGELWKAGFKVRLQGQPFRVLTMLLSVPGEVVTREELQLKIWGSDTNIDFERALAGAINKIREALNDSADIPRFVETLPKRGYRFIAPVSFVESICPKPDPAQATPASSVSDSPEQVLVLPGSSQPTTSLVGSASFKSSLIVHKELPAPNRSSRSILEIALSGLAVALVFAMLTILWLWQRQTDVPPLKVEQLTRDGSISTGPPNMYWYKLSLISTN